MYACVRTHATVWVWRSEDRFVASVLPCLPPLPGSWELNSSYHTVMAVHLPTGLPHHLLQRKIMETSISKVKAPWAPSMWEIAECRAGFHFIFVIVSPIAFGKPTQAVQRLRISARASGAGREGRMPVDTWPSVGPLPCFCMLICGSQFLGGDIHQISCIPDIRYNL